MPDPVAADRNADTQPIPIGLPPAPPEPVPGGEPPAQPARRAWRYWVGGIAAILILAAAALSIYRERPSGASGPGAEEKRIPPELRPYYDRAVLGDASAMRMLGTMYYNGLNVPQDTKEGIRWYRKAAAAGSVAAVRDLQQLGLSPTEP
jgi:TPR repeat protein